MGSGGQLVSTGSRPVMERCSKRVKPCTCGERRRADLVQSQGWAIPQQNRCPELPAVR
jgi:hypothetical protein